ncbi:MAG: NADH-quinone oxidoreductase subunit I [Planctomycetes bacterium]|nr:NADH-quinone oxidoreductase subunit I [Planctomycetota bacterium]
MGLWRRIYLPAILKGLSITLRHVFRRKVTLEYPEVLPPVPRGSRGTHRLNKDELGRERCVACFLCATVCPSRCITIVAEEAPAEWPDRDKRPRVFDIDMLRCIFCGYCEEACPCDAIELTPKFYPVGTRREEFVWTKERLLSN